LKLKCSNLSVAEVRDDTLYFKGAGITAVDFIHSRANLNYNSLQRCRIQSYCKQGLAGNFVLIVEDTNFLRKPPEMNSQQALAPDCLLQLGQ
jgi:hypothetical protein